MNILLFVFSMLMLLSIMTVARLDSYLDFNEVRQKVLVYMQEMERDHLEKKALDLYRSKKVSTGESNGSPQLNGRLDFSLFLLPSRDEEDVRYQELYQVAERLFIDLVGDEDLGARILQRMLVVVEEDQEAIKDDDALRKMDLKLADSDPMRHAFCRLLSGFYQGTEALPKYITVRRPGANISIYLAHPRLLNAIFPDGNLAAEIQSRRIELFQAYKDLKGDDAKLYAAAAEEELKSLVGGIPISPYLDYKISKTDPIKK